AFFQLLAEQSRTAHLVQFFDSTVVRAHVSAAGAKGGRKIRRLAAHAGGVSRNWWDVTGTDMTGQEMLTWGPSGVRCQPV
ncbi:MAG TPA: hypothetical protein VMU69_18920, partial [Bradyrhizobium sp.]|nr:hypothetical protein [Bradyrhizobium sp.]